MREYQEEDVYEEGEYQKSLNQDGIEAEGADQEDFFDRMPVFDARWFVLCLVVIAPLWIWPFEFPRIFAEFGISIMKAAGWLVGITLAVVLSSMVLSAIGKALIKSAHPQAKNDQSVPSH